MKTTLALATALLLAGTTTAQELWVDPVAGSDTNPGTPTMPVQTLTQAIVLAGPNAEVFLLPGVYGPVANGETLPIYVGNTQNQDGIVIRGVGNVVFDLAGNTGSVLYFGALANNARLTNISFTNSDTMDWWTRVINSGTGVNSGFAAANLEIDRCRFVNVNRGLVLWTADNTQGWRIHHNLFDNLANDAILEYSGTNQIYNNTFVQGTWKAYISDSIDSICANNLIVNYNIAFENNNGANMLSRYQNNWVYQTTTVTQGMGFASPLPPSNTTAQNPMLVNLMGGDYHPTPTSPLVEGGNNNVPPRMDLDGFSSLNDYDVDGNIDADIGCYELSPVSHTATYDSTTQVLTANLASTNAGLASFLLISFDDGLVLFPNQPPLLGDPGTFLGGLFGGFPQTYTFNLAGLPPFAPGTRVVMFSMGFRPGSPLIGGNQTWTQF